MFSDIDWSQVPTGVTTGLILAAILGIVSLVRKFSIKSNPRIIGLNPRLGRSLPGNRRVLHFSIGSSQPANFNGATLYKKKWFWYSNIAAPILSHADARLHYQEGLPTSLMDGHYYEVQFGQRHKPGKYKLVLDTDRGKAVRKFPLPIKR